MGKQIEKEEVRRGGEGEFHDKIGSSGRQTECVDGEQPEDPGTTTFYVNNESSCQLLAGC